MHCLRGAEGGVKRGRVQRRRCKVGEEKEKEAVKRGGAEREGGGGTKEDM